MLRSARALLLSSGVLLGHLSLGTACSPPAAPAERERVTTQLQVGGMVCASCSEAITAAIAKLDGVQTVHVDHASGHATIYHDPARAPREALVAAVTALGYTVAAP